MQSQNRFVKYIKKIIKNKSKAIKKKAHLPADLWPEINRAAVYLYNKISRYIFY